MLPEVIAVADVVNSPLIANPLHRLDCCVISDGGGALIVVKPEIAKSLRRPRVKILGAGETVKHLSGGTFDLTTSGAARTGPAAFAEAGITPKVARKRWQDRSARHGAEAEAGPGRTRSPGSFQVAFRLTPEY
jgi:acetyl-CoA acetyltransferase